MLAPQVVKQVRGEEVRFNAYASLDEFLTVAARGTGEYSRESNWSAACTLSEAIKYVSRGAEKSDREYIRAQALVDKVDAAIHDRTQQAWTPSVYGAYPVVPDYLAGAPDCMRARTEREDDNSPIRVCVEIMVSGGISEYTIATQGAAIAALVMKLSETRPVELYSTWMNQKTSIGPISAGMIRMGCSPISLAECVAVFTSRQFKRNIFFEHMRMTLGEGRLTGGWCWNTYDHWDEREKMIRTVLNLAPQDIVIQGAGLVDEHILTTDPVAWVNRQLEKQRHIDTEL